MKNKNKNRKIGSVIVSLIFGATFGWYLSTLVSKLFIINLNLPLISSIVGAVLIGFFGYKNPRTAELFAFLFSAWIFLQVLWDGGAEPTFGIWRTVMSYIAIGNFILNSFTGYLKLGAGLKALRRAMGGR